MGISIRFFKRRLLLLIRELKRKIITADTANYPRTGAIVGDSAKKQSTKTYYKGILFDSKTEARWAVFWDLLGINWEYHPLPAIQLGCSLGYEVDFLIDVPSVFRGWNQGLHKADYKTAEKTYVEVKGEMTAQDLTKISRFQAMSNDYPLWVVGDVPTAEFFDMDIRDEYSDEIKRQIIEHRPKIGGDAIPYYTCGMSGIWYEEHMVLSYDEASRKYVIAFDGLACRYSDATDPNKKKTRTAGGLKMWNTPDIRKAAELAHKHRL